jgi:hypothetical protein
MEIFKEKITFKSWGEIYLGLKKQWISCNEVIAICENNKIGNCSDERLVKLYLAIEESLFIFYEEIKKFIHEDNDIIIVKNEDKIERSLDYIPEKYWRIWKLEFLLRVENSENDIKTKLLDIADYYYEFNFPEDWKKFLYFQPDKYGNIIEMDKIYHLFIDYIQIEKDYFTK